MIDEDEDNWDAVEAEAKARLAEQLAALEQALDTFLIGEVNEGLITPFKVTLIVHARTLLAVAERSRRDVAESVIRAE